MEESGAAQPTAGVRMKRQLTLSNAVAVTVSVIIGSGIFLSPKGVLQATGSVGLSLIVWSLSGILATLGALCYVELGTTIPKSGGTYTYLYEIFGPWVGFMKMWQTLIISGPAGTAVLAITIANYALYPFFAPCPAPYLAVRLIAAACLGLISFLNCYSVRMAAQMNNVLTFLKVGALGIIIIFGVIQLARGHTENLELPKAFEGTTSSIGSAAVAFYASLQAPNSLIEELINPNRNLVLTIVISMPLVTIVYLLTNIAYFTAMTPAEMIASDAVAVTFANRLLGVMSWIIPTAVAVSTFATLLTGFLAWTRVYMVAARDGIMPRILSMIQVNRLTPAPAVILPALLGLFMLIPEDVYMLLTLMGFADWLTYAMVASGLLWWRYKKPDLPRPVKLNLAVPVMFVCMCLFMMVLSFVSAPVECGIGAVVSATAVPVYAVFIHWENKPAWFLSFEGFVTSRLQLILNVVPQDPEIKLE
ncbi:SLC7A5 [Branchiostoma lanceolatum]|uniref:SLC7A5 protein n=1 Tax=Branchiostoma lanceolatum TaxID=7740 RepID=A0A8K0A6G8_BRALA|nr:SLC7A5 [Branchiostoma lanceolatum]